MLSYGDSLTWGYYDEGPGRHALAGGWPSVLQGERGDDVLVIAEGLNGRTTGFDDYMDGANRNGVTILPTMLTTHGPLDLIVIMLGANDMKPWISGRAIASKLGMERLVEIVRGHAYPMDALAPQILLVAPPPLSETADADFADSFEGGIEESRKLAGHYAALADQVGCGFFDAGSVARTTPLDGVHLDAENTRAIGRALAPIVRVMLQL